MAENKIVIRHAESEDCAAILHFIQRLAEYEKLSRDCVATEEQLRATLFGEQPFAQVLIAELDGKAVGFALYFFNYSTFLAKPGIYLEDLFVEPDARGHKVGFSLLARLAAIAVEKNCGRFEWSVLDWNQPAIDFYRQIGAVAMDEWTVQRVTGDALNQLARADKSN